MPIREMQQFEPELRPGADVVAVSLVQARLIGPPHAPTGSRMSHLPSGTNSSFRGVAPCGGRDMCLAASH